MNTLNDICTLITDGSHFSPEDEGVGYPMLSVKDMNEDDFDFNDCKHVGEEAFGKLLANGCKPLLGDVVVAKDGSFLKTAFPIKEERDIAILSSIAILRPDKNKVVPEYLSYFLKSNTVYNTVSLNYISGTALKRIILKGIKKIPILLPSLEEQEMRVKLLESTREIIKRRKEQLIMLDDLIKARFVEMFGDPEVNSMDWPEAIIGDNCFVTKLAGFEYTKYINYEDTGDVVMVKAQNVKNGVLNEKDLSYISNEVSDSLPRSQLAPGDVVMTYVGANIGDVAIIDDRHKYHLAPNVAKIRPDAEKYDSMFFMHMLMMKTDYIMRNSADTAKAALGMERIRKLNVFLPPIELQSQFSEFVKQVDKSKVVKEMRNK